MPYSDIYIQKGFQHLWKLDGDASDFIGTVNGTLAGSSYIGPGIIQDSTTSLSTTTITSRMTLPDSADINSGSIQNKVVTMWFSIDKQITFFTRLWGEGGRTNTFQLVMGFGNSITFEIFKDGELSLQIFSDIALIPNRNYMLTLVFSGDTYENIVNAYIDDKIQLNANPIDRVPNITSLGQPTPIEVGDPVGTVALDGTDILLTAPPAGLFSYIATKTGNSSSPILSSFDVRDIFAYEGGAIPEYTITSGTQANMQSQIDLLDGTIFGNYPVSLKIQEVSGGGQLVLSSGSLEFNPLTSIDIIYESSLSQLNWTNTQANATTSYGNVVIENPASLTVNFTEIGSEVRIYDDNGNDKFLGDELAGVESSAGISFVFTHSGQTNSIAVQVIKDGYKEILLFLTINSDNRTINLTQALAINE
jgi:hypothetical protein